MNPVVGDLGDRWSVNDIPSLAGRVAVVTGAASGIGFQVAHHLGERGASVIVADRDVAGMRASLGRLERSAPQGRYRGLYLDLADFNSVEDAAHDLIGGVDRLDILVNNAGIMAPPYRETVQGFELQLGVNYLGHYVLTALLWNLLCRTRCSRVVTVTSAFAYVGRMRWHDLNFRRTRHSYRPYRAYAQSKLAALLFARALDARLREVGNGGSSVAAHPGIANTKLHLTTARQCDSRIQGAVMAATMNVWGQSARDGARSIVRAATDERIPGGTLCGPGRAGLWGAPRRVRVPSQAADATAAGRLMEISEELSGARFPVAAGRPGWAAPVEGEAVRGGTPGESGKRARDQRFRAKRKRIPFTTREIPLPTMPTISAILARRSSGSAGTPEKSNG